MNSSLQCTFEPASALQPTHLSHRISRFSGAHRSLFSRSSERNLTVSTSSWHISAGVSICSSYSCAELGQYAIWIVDWSPVNIRSLVACCLVYPDQIHIHFVYYYTISCVTFYVILCHVSSLGGSVTLYVYPLLPLLPSHRTMCPLRYGFTPSTHCCVLVLSFLCCALLLCLHVTISAKPSIKVQ